MLVLSRKRGEAIRIAATVEVTVLEIRRGQVKLGVSGPREIPIHREEVYRRISDRREDRSHAAKT
jgi:carbon storage regulator